jgi:probable rRNA maturation factor
MDVLIENHTDEELQPDELAELAGFVVEHAANAEVSELSISFVNIAAITELNAEYRDQPQPTDVLSFECDFGEGGAGGVDGEEGQWPQDGDQPRLLGDIVICPEVAREHAVRDDVTFTEELWILIIHGILHLFGYNHEDGVKASEMEDMEDRLIESWALHKGVDLSWQ